MIPWTTDAKDIGEISEDDLVITPSIKEFIHPDERDRILYVVAPKGIGKSLLLIYKRQLYDKKYNDGEIYLIPKDLPVDRCLDITRGTLTNEKVELLADHSKCKQIWKFCISLSIIKHLTLVYKPKYNDELKKDMEKMLNDLELSNDQNILIRNQILILPSDIFISVLTLSFNDIIKTINLQSHFSGIIRKYIRSGVAVFIDNVDQSFDDYLRSADTNSALSKTIWYTTQIGLIFAVYDLSALNGHIKVFVSVRKEAFQRMRRIGSLGSQIRGEALDIAYTSSQLKDIFINNIRIMNRKDLAIAENPEKDPIHAFLGLDNNQLESIKGFREDIFCYIHRHSLKRPRDLMIIGRHLKMVERDPKNIRLAVNSAAYEIVSDFLAEIYPFADIDFDRLFGLIHSNVLSRDDIIDICGEYNRKENCSKENCENCEMTHVFCGLYKFGLLGIVVRDLIDNEKFIQKFEQIGDVDYEERGLPNSNYYLIHPALISKIEENNLKQGTTFNVDATVIIGDGYHWKKSLNIGNVTVLDKNKRYKTFFLNEIISSSAKRQQKEGQDGQSEADSKTLMLLKNKLKDLVLSGEEITWLDVGCGNGRCLEILDEIDNRDKIFYHGIDSEYNLNAATEKAKRYGIRSSIERLYAENMNFEDKYNLISAVLVLHEVNPLRLPLILRNLLKALKNDGVLIVSDFQEPYELEKNVVIWTRDDIEFILDNICKEVDANFSIMPSDESPGEFSFYYGHIKKTQIDELGFEEFFQKYDNFLTYKEYKMKLNRALLLTKIKMRMREMLRKNDGEAPTDKELEDATDNVGLEYIIKGYKAHLLIHHIEFINQAIKNFSR